VSTTLTEQIKQVEEMFGRPAARSATAVEATDQAVDRVRKLVGRGRSAATADVAHVLDELRRMRESFEAMAAQRDHWVKQHNRLASKVATYSDGVAQLAAVTQVAVGMLGEDNFVGRLLLAVQQGLAELHQVAHPPVNTCASSAAAALGPRQ